ncbi:unnamed protein product [Brugia pahangi]|uniref:Lupeol synthase n=1 Tax=Brugia pahangi TaxID=6280 RepID=A0A0N4TET5_BRUPA|nr:unnamed protein product [Brugia pahangi]
MSQKTILLHYVHNDDEQCVSHNKKSSKVEYNYSLGAEPNPNEWRWICRDLLVDTGRALASTSKKKETILLHPGILLFFLFLMHSDRIIYENFEQRSSAHLEHFLVAADWLTNNQDEHGGWSVPVER